MLTENPFHLKKRITFHTITQISIGIEVEQMPRLNEYLTKQTLESENPNTSAQIVDKLLLCLGACFLLCCR